MLDLPKGFIMEHKVHEGRNVKRFREMLGIKQEALAFELGEDWTQKKISILEGKESVEAAVLARVAEVLKIPVDALKNFDEEQVVNIISSNFTNNDNATGVQYNMKPTFNPVDKWLEALEENKKLHEEKIALYERMLREKDEMMGELKNLIRGIRGK